jgi:hypothetical protein
MRWLTIFAVFACLAIAGCTIVDYHPPEPDPMAPVHDGSNGRS